MQPYVIKQGDYLALLAHRFGFDADAVWNDPANDDLRDLRSDPNLLSATDVLYIPDQLDVEPPTHDLDVGQVNAFVSDSPTIDVSLKFIEPEFASKSISIPELPDLTDLVTGDDGTVKVSVPVTLQQFTVVFDDETTFACKVGHLDPVDTLPGVIQRLQNLGFLNPRAAIDAIPIENVRSALGVFLATYSDDDDDSPSADGDDDSSSADDDEDSASADDGGDDDGAELDYTQVLSDDGELDDAAAKVLVKVHGA
jgi:hypothetical protein